MTERLTVDEVAALARITVKHMRRVVSQFKAGPWRRKTWRGAALRIHPGPLVDFASLPADLRDAALVARDQMEFLLPPPALPGPQSVGTATPDLKRLKNDR